jgi:hypothetical protein
LAQCVDCSGPTAGTLSGKRLRFSEIATPLTLLCSAIYQAIAGGCKNVTAELRDAREGECEAGRDWKMNENLIV